MTWLFVPSVMNLSRLPGSSFSPLNFGHWTYLSPAAAPAERARTAFTHRVAKFREIIDDLQHFVDYGQPTERFLLSSDSPHRLSIRKRHDAKFA